MKQLKISFDGQDFYADLFWDKAPHTLAALEAHVPFTSFMVYAKICDNEITWPTPFLVDEMENPVWEEELGSVIYYPPHQAICIFYGPTPAVAWCNQIGRVRPEELERLKASADKIWREQGTHITTAIVER